MKLPVSMLRDFVQTSLSPQEIGDLLTMAGFELEGLEEVDGEPVLDIKVMANRGDGLSALGLAREMLAKDSGATPTELYQRATSRFARDDEESPDAAHHVSIRIESQNCSRYAGRVFTEVQNGESPTWIAARLTQAGLRPISLLVDLTNYVMLELGQPLHAFDLETLAGNEIIVREAAASEKITTLNGDEHELLPSDLCICDRSKPIAVAGVMGGAETEVSATTTRCLLESAHFHNGSVRKTRKRLNLSTDASYRFERSVDPEGVVAALNRFAELYEQATGRSPVPGVVDVYPHPASPATLEVRVSRAEKLLGMPVEKEAARQALDKLGMDVSGDGEPFRVKVPTWRFDLEREDDLIEEIARVVGYEKIPESPLVGSTVQGGVFDIPLLSDQAREALLRCGLTQVMSHSLRDRHPLDFTTEWRVGPRNPHSPENAYLRDSVLPCLADAALRNGGRNLHLFEIGRVFVKGDHQIDESVEIGILTTGQIGEPHWSGSKPEEASFWSLKGMVEELAEALGDSIVFDAPWDPDRRFHPTRQAGVLLDHGRSWAGSIGQIHPDLADKLGLPRETFLAELDLFVFAIHDNADLPLRPVSRNPATRRDIAFVIPKEVAWSQIEGTIRAAAGEDLERMWLFDVYSGTGIPEDSHSLAVAMQLRRMGENLTDEIANGIRDQVVAAVESLGAKLR